MEQLKLQLWADGNMPGAIRAGDAGDDADFLPFLETFILDAEKPSPLVVVLPGGGYGGRAAHEGTPIAEWLNSIGISAVVCYYRCAPWNFPAPLLDAQQAVRIVRGNATKWNIDPNRIGILGFSAGGHLAASVACFGHETPDAVVNAHISCYAVISNNPEVSHAGSFRNLYGENPPEDLRRKLSLENSVTPANPPTFIWHTTEDGLVPIANALLFADALRRANVPFAMHVYPKGSHGLGLARAFEGSANRWTEDCAAWLKEIDWR